MSDPSSSFPTEATQSSASYSIQKLQLPSPIETPVGKSTPIVPWVLSVGMRLHPWQVPEIVARPILYHTSTTLKVLVDESAATIHQHLVYALPDAQRWQQALELHSEFVQALSAYANGLMELGNYQTRLQADGGFPKIPKPLCDMVIKNYYNPQEPKLANYAPWNVELSHCYRTIRHTNKMLEVAHPETGASWGLQHQSLFWFCPNEEAWQKIQKLQAKAVEASEAMQHFLMQLGTYAEAKADGRYVGQLQFDWRLPSSTPKSQENINVTRSGEINNQIKEIQKIQGNDDVLDVELREVEIAALMPSDPTSHSAQLLQPRVKTNESVVERYVQMLEYTEPPPIDVFEIDGVLWLAHGYHRRAAAVQAGRTHILAKIYRSSWAECVILANTANLDNGLQLEKIELERACKNFLQILPHLSAEHQDKWSNRAIAKRFGYCEATIRNYKKDVERDRTLAQFAVGNRVQLSLSENQINGRTTLLLKLPETERLGVVCERNSRHGIRVQFDHPRLQDCVWWLEPQWLTLTHETAKTYSSPIIQVGDRVKDWRTGEIGIVVCIADPAGIWSTQSITPAFPLVFWDTQQHNPMEALHLDVLGKSEIPTTEQRIHALKAQLTSIDGEGAISTYLHEKLNRCIHHLQPPLPPLPPVLSTQPSTPQPEWDSIEDETRSFAENLGLNGSRLQILKSPGTANGKHLEDPLATAIGILEPPPAIPTPTTLEQARLEARKSAVRSAIAAVKVDAMVLGSSELLEFIQSLIGYLGDEQLQLLIEQLQSELTQRDPLDF